MNSSIREERNADDGEVSLFKGAWRKSSFSGSNGDCVEVAFLGSDHVGVRDSKATAGPYLRFPPDVWIAFIGHIRDVHSSGRDSIR